VHQKADAKGVELADAQSVRKAFGQVNEQFAAMMKISQHNTQVVQMGFYKNDIWLETFRMMVFDIAETVDAMCRDTSIQSRIRMNAEGKIDLDFYWADASETVKQQMEESNKTKPEDGTPTDPVIARADDEKPIIFGGDHEVGKDAQECDAAEERDSGGEEHNEAGDAPDALPTLSGDGGADAPV